MIDLRGVSVALLIMTSIAAPPAAAQSRDNAKSLTHVVSVSVPARVKVTVRPVAMASAMSIPAAVGLGVPSSVLALEVDANRAWVLSLSSLAGSSNGSLTPENRPGQFTAVINRDGNSRDSRASGRPVVLTVSAP